MVGNLFEQDPLPKGLTKDELGFASSQKGISRLLHDGKGPLKTDMWVFPNEMGDELASKVPPVFIQTAEYDFYRTMSREAADLYRRNGALLGFAEYGGAWHGSSYLFGLPTSDTWYADFSRMTDKYLQ